MESKKRILANFQPEESYNNEIKETINELLDKKISDNDLQVFFQSVSVILKNETENLLYHYQKRIKITQKAAINQNLNNQMTPINIYMIQSPFPSNNIYPITQYQQQTLNPLILSNYQNVNPYQYSYPLNPYSQLPINYSNAHADKKNQKTYQKEEKKSKKDKKSKKSKKSKKDKKEKKSKKDDKKLPPNVKEFKYQPGVRFNGIISYLTRKTGGNIHKNGTIAILSNNITNCEAFVDQQDNFRCASSSKGETTICFDFKQRKVQLVNYSILSFNNDEGRGQIKNWVVEVSKDNSNWIEIDRRENDPTLNKSGFLGSFEVKQKKKKFFQFIRIRQTGVSWDPHDVNDFGFNAIEFYGFLEEN